MALFKIEVRGSVNEGGFIVVSIFQEVKNAVEALAVASKLAEELFHALNGTQIEIREQEKK